jgi:hypothetical protein
MTRRNDFKAFIAWQVTPGKYIEVRISWEGEAMELQLAGALFHSFLMREEAGVVEKLLLTVTSPC